MPASWAAAQPGSTMSSTSNSGGPQRVVDRGVDPLLGLEAPHPADPPSVAESAGAKPGSSSAMPSTTRPTVAAIGPTVSIDGASGHMPSSGMRPKVVFRPTTPHHAAGLRIDPAVSVPSATSASSTPGATATPDPLDEPPGTRPAS